MTEPSRDPLRQSLRAMSHGVYILSVHQGGIDDYIVVSLAMQCSVQPPRIAFAVAPGARLMTALRTARSAVLAVLAESERAAVRRYGVPGGVKHPPHSPDRTKHGHAIPPEASHWLEVQIMLEIPAGDHVLFVADVCDAGVTRAVKTTSSGVGSTGGTSVLSTDESSATSAASRYPGPAPTTTVTPMTLASSGFPYGG